MQQGRYRCSVSTCSFWHSIRPPVFLLPCSRNSHSWRLSGHSGKKNNKFYTPLPIFREAFIHDKSKWIVHKPNMYMYFKRNNQTKLDMLIMFCLDSLLLTHTWWFQRSVWVCCGRITRKPSIKDLVGLIGFVSQSCFFEHVQ